MYLLNESIIKRHNDKEGVYESEGIIWKYSIEIVQNNGTEILVAAGQKTFTPALLLFTRFSSLQLTASPQF